VRSHLAGKGGEIAQRVVGMRVVDDDRERLTCIDGLKAAGDWFKEWREADEAAEFNSSGVGRGEGGEQVEDVDFAGEARDDLGFSGRGFQTEVGAAGVSE